MRNILFLTFIFLLCISGSYSQENIIVNRKEFFMHEDGRQIAKNDLKRADDFFHKGNYREALPYYLKVYKYNSSSPSLNYKLGVCYLFTSDKRSSLKYFQESEPAVSKKYYLYLGRAYQYNYLFEKAEDYYTRYYDSLPKHKRRKNKAFIEQLKKDCETGTALFNDSVAASVVNLGIAVNSIYDDYNGILSADNSVMYFTSRRPLGSNDLKKPKKRLKEHILVTNNNAIDFPASSISLIKGFTSQVNTGIVDVDLNDPLQIYYYDGRKRNGGTRVAIKKDTLLHKKRLKKINSFAFRETSVSFDRNGNAYFVSDRTGGYGGKDIWFAKHKGKQSFHRSVNLGKTINTDKDEEGVYITPDGKILYFSSKGHPGMGGFDVFMSVKKEDGEWSKPRNLGYPINSPADELFYRDTPDSMVAIYTTIRSDSYGGYDIYKILKGGSISFVMSGIVTDAINSKIIPATIKIFNAENNTLIKTIYNDPVTGGYIFKISKAGEYMIQVESKYHISQTKSYRFRNGESKTEMLNFRLAREY